MAAATKKKKIQQPNLIGNVHLENSPLNLLSIREHGRNEVKQLLSRVKAKTKHLIWDQELIGPLNYIIQTKMLNDLGINARTTLDLKSDKLRSDCDAIIYFAFPRMKSLRAISKQIVTHSRGRKKDFYLFLFPHQTYLSTRALKQFGAFGSLNPISSVKSHIESLNIEWYPIDSDVLSMEKHDCLSQLISGDIASLKDIAIALTKLQAIFGKFPCVRAKGDLSCAIVDIMRRCISEMNLNIEIRDNSDSLITQCILIDRTTDMVTPMLTPRTYEGLLDSVFGIENSMIRVSKNMLGKSAQKTKTRGDELTIVLNSSDLIFKQVRDTSFRYLGRLLTSLANQIQQGYNDRHNAKTSAELNRYIKRFKNLHADHGLVEQHIHLADHVSGERTKKMSYRRKCEQELSVMTGEAMPSGVTGEDYLQEMIGRGDSIECVLQFLILLSICNGGISSKKYDSLRKDIVQTYGAKHIYTLQRLEEYGLIRRYETFKRYLYSQSQSEYCNWNAIRKQFSLILSEKDLNRIITQSNDKRPTAEQTLKMVTNPHILGHSDMNLVGAGYAPLSARLVEAATRPHGWDAIATELAELRGKCYLNQTNQSLSKNKTKQTAEQKSNAMSTHKTVLVFFVGGVTFAEISAIRMLQQRPNTPWKFIVASTNIANGKDIINAFIPKDID